MKLLVSTLKHRNYHWNMPIFQEKIRSTSNHHSNVSLLPVYVHFTRVSQAFFVVNCYLVSLVASGTSEKLINSCDESSQPMVLHVGFVAPSAPAVRRRAARLGSGHVVYESLAVVWSKKTWWKHGETILMLYLVEKHHYKSCLYTFWLNLNQKSFKHPNMET